jgi:hypothetical protein
MNVHIRNLHSNSPQGEFSTSIRRATRPRRGQLNRWLLAAAYSATTTRTGRIWESKRTLPARDRSSCGKWGRLSRFLVWLVCTTATHGSCEIPRRRILNNDEAQVSWVLLNAHTRTWGQNAA